MLPALSSATPHGTKSPVLGPLTVRAGSALPIATGAYTVMLPAPFRFATYKFPVLSSATPHAPKSPVLGPLMVRVGATLPFAVGANTAILSPPILATKRPPALASATPVGTFRPAV